MKANRIISTFIVLLTAAVPAVHAQDIHQLVQDLSSSSSEKRMNAASTLGELGANAAPAVPALTSALRDDDAYVRNFAASALGLVGPAAGPAVPELIRALHDADESVVQAAQRALGGIGPGAKAAVPELVILLRMWQSSAAENPAAYALIRIGVPSVKSLTEVARDDDNRVALAAIYCLGEIGSKSPEAVAALKTTFQSSDPSVCENSAVALRKLGEVSIPIFRQNLSHKDATVRKHSAWSLAKMNAKSAIPALEKQFLADKNPEVKQAIKWSIDHLQGKEQGQE